MNSFSNGSLAAIFAVSFFTSLVCADDRIPSNSVCYKRSIDVEINNALFQMGSDSSLLIELLSGDIETVENNLGDRIASAVIDLNFHIAINPCGLSKEEIDRIYSMLRVVAAANYKKPFPVLKENREVIEILDHAIENNPAHYKKLLDRADNWNRGIK